MSREEFWTPIFNHPDVARLSLCGMGGIEDVLWFLDQPGVHEERYEGGGFIFVDKGRNLQELHAAFLPEFWGRGVVKATRECFRRKMNEVSTVILHEQEGEWRTRPPISHGWKVVGEFKKSVLPRRVRRWMLTRDAWINSPAGRSA